MDQGQDVGTLVLVGTPIGNLEDLSARAVATLSAADVICCEDTRHTGLLLQRVGISAKKLMILNAHNEAERCAELVALVAGGAMVALVSDAGMPAISDPGERLVAAAIASGVTVSVVPGPFAGVAALVLSGFSTERWCFEGFLPRKGQDRHVRIDAIATSLCPSVVYESPHRVRATLADFAASCGPNRRVVIARELTKLHEEINHTSLSEAMDLPSVVGARGEFVVIVDGADGTADQTSEEIAAACAKLIDADFGARDAAKAIEVLLGVPHRQAYAVALAIKHERATLASTKDAK